MNKQELIEKVDRGYADWQSLLSQVGEARMTEPGVTGDWSVKDIIAHIAAWEQRVLDRMESEAKGASLEMTGWEMDKVNDTYYQRSKALPLQEVLSAAATTHRRFMEFLDTLSDEDLFQGGRFAWTKGAPFYQWVEGNTYEHYDEHAASIRAWL